jgi:FkbM family methyltransferase
LRDTPASELQTGHIDSLELLEMLSQQRPKVIYDIGANVGVWTILAKTIFPDSEVHAFEPLANHSARFTTQTAGLQSVYLHNIALGNVSGETDLHVVDFTDATSVLPLAAAGQDQWDLRETEVQKVRIERLDTWVSSKKLPWPDLIKLDVQGFELQVMQGGSKCLESARVVLTEVSFHEYYRGQCLFHDIVGYLANFRFRVFALGRGTAVGQPLTQADVLFIKSD